MAVARREFRFEGDEVRIRQLGAGVLLEPRSTLEKAGRPIGAYELLISAHAVRYKMTLITANSKEFSVKGLVWEDWAK